jgi:hypothetical protein
VDAKTLEHTGTYTLLIEGRVGNTVAGAFEFNVQRVTDGGRGIVLDETVTDTITHPGQKYVYTFTLNSDTLVHFDSQADRGDVFWSLTGPRGPLFSGTRDFNASDADSINGNTAFMLHQGSYTLTVDASGAATGNPFAFRLLNLTQGPTHLDLPASPTLTGQTLVPASSSRAYSFTATRGDRITLDVTTSATNVVWRLLDPFGRMVWSDARGLADQANQWLEYDGTYTLLVEGRRYATGTPTFGFNLLHLGNEPIPALPTGTPYTLGNVVTQTLATAAQVDRHTFSVGGTTPVRVYFDSRTNVGGLTWTLQGPRGTQVTNRGFSSSDGHAGTSTLDLEPGDYVLSVTGSATPYSFRLLHFCNAEFPVIRQ